MCGNRTHDGARALPCCVTSATPCQRLDLMYRSLFTCLPSYARVCVCVYACLPAGLPAASGDLVHVKLWVCEDDLYREDAAAAVRVSGGAGHGKGPVRLHCWWDHMVAERRERQGWRR